MVLDVMIWASGGGGGGTQCPVEVKQMYSNSSIQEQIADTNTSTDNFFPTLQASPARQARGEAYGVFTWSK